jgi:hypothetical protein
MNLVCNVAQVDSVLSADGRRPVRRPQHSRIRGHRCTASGKCFCASRNRQLVESPDKKSAGGHKGVVGAARALDPIPRRVSGEGYLLPR